MYNGNKILKAKKRIKGVSVEPAADILFAVLIRSTVFLSNASALLFHCLTRKN